MNNIERFHFITQENHKYSHLQCVAVACEAGVKWIQLRVKDKPENELLSIAEKAKLICDNYNVKLVINDFPFIADKIKCDGVHLGKEDMSVTEARKIIGSNKVIGATANTINDIILLAESKPDYIGVGPLRFTNTKKKLSPVLGFDGYKMIISECIKNNINIPLIAIGGIEIEDIKPLMDIGLYGIAASTLLANSKNMNETFNMINKILN